MRSQQPRWQAAFLFGAAVLLLALAAPRLVASLWELRPLAYLDSAQTANVELTDRQLDIIKPELEEALQAVETAHNFENLARVSLHLAKLSGAREKQRRMLLAEAEQALRSSLAYACANPYAWLHLALISKQLGKDSKVITEALAMSFLTGRAEAGLYIERLNLAFEYYPAMNNDNRSLIAQQLRLAWKSRRNEVLKLALHYQMEEALSAALSHSPANR